MSDLEMQQYLFDVQGYLVIEGVLSAEELAALNQLVDAQRLPPPEEAHRFGSAAGRAPEGPGFLGWGRPFCDLLDHPRTMPILRFRLGDCFRLDRIYGLQMSAGMTWGPLHADYGAFALHAGSNPGEYHPFRDNQILNGFAVAAWNLTAAGPDHGGFCCIPGSHTYGLLQLKHLPQLLTEEMRAQEVPVPVPAGGCLLFHSLNLHYSSPNTSAKRRRAWALHYMAAKTKDLSTSEEVHVDYISVRGRSYAGFV